MIVAFRRHRLLPLDDCLYALQLSLPHLNRSSIHCCLQQHGRRLLVVGATAFMRCAKDKTTPIAARVQKLLEKKPFRLASVALANKIARIAWVVLTRGELYRPYRPAT